jgi:ribosomal-protein-alanine N-acetyltransferase
VDTERITLHFANPDEAGAIAALSRDLIETGLGWQYHALRIRAFIADPNAIALVARIGSSLAGFAIMTFGDDRAHLVLLAVRPAFQRRRLGRRMLDWLVESAQTAGIASVHVELRAGNRAAYRLYCSAGFAETLRLPGYYRGRESAIRMLRLLRAPAGALPPP